MNPLVTLGSPSRFADETAARVERWSKLYPSQALLYVENKCNLRCAHCYESEASHPPHARTLSLDEYARVFDEMKQLGVLELTFSGGEIFLRRDLLDLVALARKKRFSVTLYTSGFHIDEAKADRIAVLKVKSVEISVYSHDPQVHDEFTGIPGSWARSTRALRLLHERGVKTVLKSNIMTFNVDHLDALIALAGELGADWSLDPSVRAKMDGDPAPLRFGVSPDVLRRKVLSRPDFAAHFRQRSAEEFCRGEGSLMDDETPMCGAARETFALAADGGVLGCGFFPTAVGNVREASLVDIWRGSKRFDEIRRATFATQSECGTCDVKSTCHPCMAQSEIESGHHTGCNGTSRHGAVAVRELAAHKVRANEKMSRGRALPLVGDVTFTPEDPKGMRLQSEP
ncbi:MAG: radical SAM protein [Myxococcota bacterium]